MSFATDKNHSEQELRREIIHYIVEYTEQLDIRFTKDYIKDEVTEKQVNYNEIYKRGYKPEVIALALINKKIADLHRRVYQERLSEKFDVFQPRISEAKKEINHQLDIEE